MPHPQLVVLLGFFVHQHTQTKGMGGRFLPEKGGVVDLRGQLIGKEALAQEIYQVDLRTMPNSFHVYG